MNSEQIDALANRIMALINSQLRSPTKAEIVNTILSVNCDPKLQQPVSDLNVHALTMAQLPSHQSNNCRMGQHVWGVFPVTPDNPHAVQFEGRCVYCGTKQQGITNALTSADPNVHAITTTNGIGLTMADVVKIAHDEADHATKMFGYAGLTFTAKYDMMTDNVFVTAECGSSLRPALGFAVTHKAIVAPDAAAIKSAVGVQCFRLGEMMLNAVPERFHS